ncbi:T9SS type B sorting domain-containing protein [Hwangdonia seohaensis]|uniref:T9SS type B sorting domain-containing protein n=1 Tax=Hwangdonia seohaensis TaxID=1240727 RepID=A0ABW3RAL4_9FLAO|nr:T9SS type B sorting domain-containing protein [Hwangdonia seohaensis]
MKKTTYVSIGLVAILLLISLQAFSQNFVPFAPRFNQDLKGDIVLIGNNILGPDNNAFNDNSTYNHRVNMRYIDIDGDASTFSSSSADLVIPDPSCYNIIHAGLYWSAVNSGSEPITDIKFKGPSGSYNDVVGTVIFNSNGTSVDGGNSFPYACYADVTGIVTGLATNIGTYTVANVSSAEGRTASDRPYNGTGHSAGWSLFIVYENPTLPGKSITSFDGFSAISVAGGNPTLDVPVSGFRTVPAPTPVRANFAFAALEGDSPILGDQLLLNGVNLSTADRPATNFFNSSVTQLSALPVNNRNPNSTNTLGFDTGVMVVPNPGNTVIANNATSATVRLETSGDTYFPYFYALAVDIIEPNIVLTKIVEDALGNDIGGQLVSLGDELNYVIGFQNTGNDNATSLIIRDILPINVVFNYPSDLGILPPGVSVQNYDSTTREIIFEVDNSVVEVNDPVQEIRFKVTVVQTCSLLNDACDNIISNQAFATYNGTLNPSFTISDDPSFNTNAGCLLNTSATNFLADIDCVFSEEVILCGASTVLTAGDGYDSYSWSTSPSGTPVIGTTQSITVTTTGTYYVQNTATAPCQSIDQEFEVITFGAGVTNPLIPFADQVVVCPNDGKELPNFFLCGAGDTRDIQTNITDTSSIIWERLDETSCAAVANQDCANEDPGCTWNQVATGPNYLIDTAGQYRLTLNYTGGCFNQFYFNVYTNLLVPTVSSRDIFCTTPGEIVVGGVPSGYEYSIDGTNYQASNTFSITTPNIYSVYIRQIGVSPNPCIFTVPDVQIRERDFTVSTIINQPYCNGELGSVVLAANDVRPQYFFSIYDGATLVNSVGPINDDNYTFSNLNPGIYTVNISTEDGCTFSDDIEIINPPLLEATAAITQPLTCTDGEITVYPVGGTPPYFYFVNSTTVFQTTPIIPVTSAGVYNITVVDSNNCSTDTSITVDTTPAPDFNVTKTDILCADDLNSGSIDINVTNPNGNSLRYSIDNGTTFFNSPIFTGLTAGNYDVVVEYTFGTDVCLSAPQPITIISATAISGTATLTTPYTCTTNGVITVSGVSGGNPPYTYSLDGFTFQAGTTFSGLTDGTYTVTIQDANSCTFVTAPITIDPLNPPTDLTFSNTPLSCPAITTDVTITGTTGGTLPLEYQIIAPAVSATAYQSSNVFSGLAPGTYTFQVRDANDCVYSENYTINDLPPLSIVAQTTSDVSCFGGADGAIQYNVSGTTNFNYTINGGTSQAGSSPINLTGLSAGTYNIVITDNDTNCTSTASATVGSPSAALTLSADTSPITCNDDGSVRLTVTGGWGGNTFTVTQPDATSAPTSGGGVFSGLTQTGTYTATVTDANGCVATTTFVLNPYVAPTASIATTSNLCYNSTSGASLEVTASGGQTPYQYSINGGAFVSTNTFTNLTPDSYVITVRDAYGCDVVLPAQIIAPQLNLNTVLNKGLDCTATADAQITGTFSGGYAPYTYAVSFNGGAYASLGATGSPFNYNTNTDGTYQFRVTDAQGCTVFSAVETVNAISLPEITSLTPTEPLCYGDSSGAIDVVINNTMGTPPFTINVLNTTTGTDYGTQTSSLPSGDYTVTLTDANSCTDVETVTISEPNPIAFDLTKVDITCNNPGGSSLGSITVENVTGGTAPFTYFITNNFGDVIPGNPYSAVSNENHTFNIINFGTYTINVVDANGCSLSQQIVIASPPSDLLIDVATVVPDCTSGGTAVVQAISVVGSGSYEFAILEFNTSPYALPTSYLPPDVPGGDTRTFTNLTPGVVYTFVVHDLVTDCYYVKSADAAIDPASPLTSSVIPNNVVCLGEDNGSVTFTIDNFDSTTTSVDYAIYRAFTNVLIDGPTNVPVTFGVPETVTTPAPGTLSIGQYYIVFTENGTGAFNGCETASAIFEINESSVDLDITASVDTNANCNPSSGVISAIATHGTAPYLYQITTSVVPPLATDPSWASASTFNVNAGTYYVHVIDAYGCIRSTSALVMPTDPEPVITAVNSNACTATEGNFEIDVALTTSGVAPYSFSIDGGAFQVRTTPFTLSGLSSGSHTVEVRDVNGCGNLVTVDIEAPLGISAAVTALPTCAINDGEITVTGAGGSGSYTYSISPSPATIVLVGNTFTGVPAGTYTITITDTVTGCTNTTTVSLDAATPVTFDAPTITDATCNGGSDGLFQVNLSPTNDNPVYTYQIIAGPTTTAVQNSNVFTGLTAGTYTVEVNSGRGCTNTQDITIAEPPVLTASGSAIAFACAADNSVNPSTLTITATGGTAPYTYSIDGTNYLSSNTFEIIDTNAVQNITFYVKDNNGCDTTGSVVINPLIPITSTFTGTPVDCNASGTVTINATGGSGNFEYRLLPSGVAQVSNVFSITSPGDYYFEITDTTTGCYITTAAYSVAPYDTATIALTPTAPVTCFGDNSGAFELLVNGYSGNYTYTVLDSFGTAVPAFTNIPANTSTNPISVTGMAAGSYSVEITETDSPFCTASGSVIINSPAAALSLTASETSSVTCDDNSGTITAVATGGWGTYEYELTGAATVAYSSNGTFNNLSAGNYTVNVRDAGGCIVSNSVSLVVPPPITATATANAPVLSCFGDSNGTITVSAVSGGQGSNYSYTLNMIAPTVSTSGPQSSNVFNGLVAGTYNVEVTDAYNCTFTSADIVITEPSPIQSNLVAATTTTCTTDASLTLSATGGTGTYEYSSDAAFSTVLGTFASSITINGATPGTYQYYVRDANGCVSSVSNEITIDPLPALVVNLDTTNASINCAGDSTGVIIATAEGGLGSYIYTLQDGTGTDISPAPVQTSPGVFTDLPVGTYQVQVDSGDCLTVSAQTTITEPIAPLVANFTVTDVTCTGSNNGVMEITASGGTGIIKYAISPQLNQFFETPIFEDLAPGTYQAIAQDELGCYVILDFTVSEPLPVMLTIVPNSIIPEVCNGDLDGEFSIDISGGTLPYSVSLDDINGTYTPGTLTQTQFDFTGLAGGDHVVYVRDAQGCESEWNITFPPSVLIDPMVAVDFGCTNNLSTNTVTVTVDASVNPSDLDYSLNGGAYQTSNVFNDVPPGLNHFIDVRHTNGCIQRTDTFDIAAYDPLTLSLEDGALNEIVAIASGGTGDYEFTLNGESYGSTNTFLIYASGDYTVTVTDSNGCFASVTRYFEYVDVCIPNYFTPNNDGNQDEWGPGCTDQYRDMTFDIFDRYGRKVATLRAGEKWDGKYNSKELPTGDYWYVVRLNDTKDNREFVGHFTLYR